MRPDPIVGAEACSDWLKQNPKVLWAPIFLICEVPGCMWLQSTGRMMALKHVTSGVTLMLQDERYAEDDAKRLFIDGAWVP